MISPNVIIIYADDLGYGDLSCYGAYDIQTPNIDRLLEHGIKFNCGYSTSSVCTPARYGLLTGEYPFRKKDARILPGDAACLISKDKMTLPKVFQKAGYQTAVIGKWHLGLGESDIDWNTEITHTPNDLGFDYSFIFPGTNDRVPCVYVENRQVKNLDPTDPIEVQYVAESPFPEIPTYAKNPELLKLKSSHGHKDSIINGVGRMGFMKGGTQALWKDEELAEDFLTQSKAFISKNKNTPFFLYYALHQPHVPRLPSKRFAGTSPLGPRGDVIAELDWCVGEVVAHLKKENLYENTMIIFSSDNGPTLDDGYQDEAVALNGEHKAAGELRGSKYSKFEGGARVPFIVSWNSHIPAKTSDALISQVDFTASFAKMLNIPLADQDCVDSIAQSDLLLGKDISHRDEIIFENNNKSIVLRKERWSYIMPSAGKWLTNVGNELGNTEEDLLYNLYYDIGQKNNLAAKYHAVCKALKKRAQEISVSSRTR